MKKMIAEAQSIGANDELVLKKLLDVQQLAGRMALDGRLTLRAWKYWIMEEEERRRELENFKAFQEQQIKLAVRAESYKNHNEIRDRRVNLSEVQLNLERVRERVKEAHADREHLRQEIEHRRQLLDVVNNRTGSEGSATEEVELQLKQAQDAMAAAAKGKRAATKQWEAVLARANKEQREHAEMIQQAEGQLKHAQQLLHEQESIELSDDRTADLRATIEQLIASQQEVRQQAADAQAARAQLKDTISSLQDEVEREQGVVEVLATEHRDALATSSAEHARMDAEMAEQQQLLQDAQDVLAKDAGELRGVEDTLFSERQQCRAAQAAIESAVTTKGALEAEMQRIEKQYKLALAEHDKTTREVLHHRERVKELRESMALDERALKHRCKERAEDLRAEEELYEYVTNALREAEAKHQRLKNERKQVLPKLEASITAKQQRAKGLEQQHTDLSSQLRHEEGECTRLTETHTTLTADRAELERRLSRVEAGLEEERRTLEVERDVFAERVSSAPSRQEAKTQLLARLQAEATAVATHTEELVGTIGEREEEIQAARGEARALAAATKDMVAETERLVKLMEENVEAHVQRVANLKEETAAVKKHTRQLVVQNEPVAREFVKEQGRSFGLRQTMAAEIARELEVEMQVQRQREALMYQRIYAYSLAVYAKLKRHRQQLTASKDFVVKASGVYVSEHKRENMRESV